MPEPAPSASPPPRPRWTALVREFFRELFDFQFSTFLTTRMLPGVYVFGIVLAAFFTSYVVYLRFQDSRLEGLVWLVLGPLMFFGLVIALRITLEFVLAVFRVAWYVEQVASHTQVVSEELPRFGYLRTLLFGKSAPPPGPRP